MLTKLSSGFTFRAGPPAAIDFTGAPAATPATLLAVIDVATGAELFIADDPTLGGQWQGRVLVLDSAAAGVSAADQIFAWVSDGRTAAGDDTLQGFRTDAHADAVAALTVAETLSTEGTLKGVRDNVSNFAAANHADLTTLDGDLKAGAAQAHTDASTAHQDAGATKASVDTLDADTKTGFATNHQDLAGISGKVALDSTLQQIKSALLAQIDFTETVWTDYTNYYLRRTVESEGTGSFTVVWTDTAGNIVPAPSGAEPVSKTPNTAIETAYVDATAAGTGISVGDVLARVLVLDTRTRTVLAALWHNMTTGAAISAPAAGSYVEQTKAVVATTPQLPGSLGAKSASASLAVTIATDGQFVQTVGLPTDAPAADDTSSASIVSILRRGLARWTTYLARVPVLGSALMAASTPVTIASDQPPLPTLPFAPARGTTMRLTVGPAATTNPPKFPATAGVTSYRVRNEATSASPVTWALPSSSPPAAPVIPTPYDVTGANGTPGDKTIDPGGVEIIALSAAQMAAAAAGNLMLAAICPPTGSAVLSVTLGTGA